jgi:glycosyltransferase involved in cell wall biosynthesis
VLVSGPTLTVCVSTRNRSHLLSRLVDHLERQDLPRADYEVVIVDNGSGDDTWDVLQEIAAAASIDLRVLRNPPGKGPAAGRNRAWRDARGEICAFTDDDCMPTGTWLRELRSSMQDRSVAVAGRILPPPGDERRIGPFDRVVTALGAFAGWGATANFAARRADLEEVGGFDEEFRNAAGEDTDLALRLMEHGVPFDYVDSAVVLHRVEKSGLRGLLRDQQRWVDVPAVFTGRPWARRQLLHHGLFWKSTHPGVLMVVAGLLVSRRRPGLGAALAVPWLHERLCRHPLSESVPERVAAIPGALILDASEVTVMIRGSIRHREVVL